MCDDIEKIIGEVKCSILWSKSCVIAELVDRSMSGEPWIILGFPIYYAYALHQY